MNGWPNREYFDCNCEFGPYRTKVYRSAESAMALLMEMDKCGIDRALVSHTAIRFDSPVVGNQRLLDEIMSFPRLVPSWGILPASTREMPWGEELVRGMKAAGVRALRLFPNEHRYSLNEISWSDQLPVLAERKIPVFIKARIDTIADLLHSFPSLTVITGTHGFNPLDRYAWPLIERYKSLYYETSCYLTDGAIEEFCSRFGARRLLFGSGYPENAKGAALFRLHHAGISDEEKSSIASGNLDNLLEQADLT